jgi:thiamine transport system permease protein
VARTDGVSPTRPRRDVPLWGSVSVVVVLVVIAVPVVAVLWRTVVPDGSVDLEAFGRLLSSPRTWRLVAVTVAQAAASCALTLAVGVPVAWVLARFSFPGRGLLRTVATVPFVLPAVVIGAAFASLMGPRGLFDARATWWPILAAHLCFNLAVVLRTVGAALASVDRDLEPAARLLGATPFAAARRLVLPAVAPAIAAAGIIVFLFCLTSFGVIVILGGGSVTTVEVEIWTRATRQFDLSGAGVLSLLQLLAVLATLAVHARVARRRVGHGGSIGVGARRPNGRGQWAAVAAAGLAIVVVSVLPLLALFERSLRVGSELSLANWSNLGSVTAGTGLRVSPWEAVAVSVVTSLVATAMALALALPAVRVVARRPGGAADRVLLLPLGVSSTTIGLGLLLAFGRPPLDLRGSWWLVPVAQALVALPLVVRVVLPALRAIPTSVLDGAALLGVGPSRRWWRVELPIVRRSVAAGSGLALVACLGEFGATVFLARSGRPTVPVAIERLMSRPGGAGFGQAMALSCVLVLLCATVVALVDRWLGRDDRDLEF